MADPNDPYAYLSGLSAHPNRPGDTSNFNPAFATPLANAIRQARAAGLPVGVMSGFREPTTIAAQGGKAAAYDAGGNSSHTYGLASDISGLDGPNGKITQQWAQIAQQNGLHNPYGVGDKAEFNHWQLPAQPLEQNPQLLASLQAAKASGNMQAVWSAYNAGGGPSRVATATPGTTAGDYFHTVMQHETGGRNIPAAEGGAAGGYYQFSPSTWATVRAARPDLNLPGNVLDATLDQQTAATHQLTSQNVAALQGANLPITDKNVYMAHFLGADGATKFLGAMNKDATSPAASMFPAEAKANPNVFYDKSGNPLSLGDVYAKQTGSFSSGNTTGFGTAVASGQPAGGAIGTTINSLTGAPGQPSDFMKSASQLDKALGGKGLGQQDQGQGQDQPRPPQILPAPAARNVSPLFGPQYGQQLYGTTLNSMLTPPSGGSGQPNITGRGPASPYETGAISGGMPVMAGPQVAAGVPQGEVAQQFQQMQQQLQQQALMQQYGGLGGLGGLGGMNSGGYY